MVDINSQQEADAFVVKAGNEFDSLMRRTDLEPFEPIPNPIPKVRAVAIALAAATYANAISGGETRQAVERLTRDFQRMMNGMNGGFITVTFDSVRDGYLSYLQEQAKPYVNAGARGRQAG